MATGNPIPEPTDEFLQLFDADRERARAALDAVYRRLVKFFEFKDCLTPEDLAQDTILRAIRRVQEGTAIRTSPDGYLFGIAFNVLKEDRRAAQRHPLPVDEVPEPASTDEVERIELTIAMREFLRHLTPADRELLFEYFLGDREKLRRRRRLNENALRVRAHRLKQRCLGFLRSGLSKTGTK